MKNLSLVDSWFSTNARLASFVADLMMAELTGLRKGMPINKDMLNNANEAFGESNLQLDSLELMALSIGLSRAIHLDESNLEENLFNPPTLANWLTIAHKSLSVFSKTISFKSSGSTGFKKYHSHELALLEQEAQFLGDLFAGQKRILYAVPSHHIYGFIFTNLLPRYLGVAIPVIDVRNLSSTAVQSLLSDGDLIIGYPEFWQYLDESNVRFPVDIIGVNSSAPCAAEIGINLLDKNLSGFYEVYGSSETAGIGYRDHPSKSYTLFPFWQKATLDTEIVRLLPDGKTLNFPLQDVLFWSMPNQFTVKGRLDFLVQIGGNNVSLSAVRAKLIKHPFVKDATVRVMRLNEGSRLKAFIVLNHAAIYGGLDNPDKANQLEITKHLQHYICTHLSTAEQPKALTFGLSLPVNHMGKLCDWTI